MFFLDLVVDFPIQSVCGYGRMDVSFFVDMRNETSTNTIQRGKKRLK